MSIFKQGMMRKPDKTFFCKVIRCDEDAVKYEDIKTSNHYDLDCGALLHRVRWFKGMKFNVVADVYSSFIKINYQGFVTAIFDGYQDEGTKSHEYLRRDSIPQSCNVVINKNKHVPFTQDLFPSNIENKANFINFLSHHLNQLGYLTVNCPGDADSTVVKTALDIANTTLQHVTVVTDDTDIAVMFIYHWKSNISDIYFLQDKWDKAWSIKDACLKNKTIKQHLLFIHEYPWLGCYTISSVFGKSKTKLVERISDEI
nr:uncharacterized protein LOC124817025 [Hydra vulgaris]XP_047142776.1 uncharacterized protein LOC124817025 [Hydra vulgaris]